MPDQVRKPPPTSVRRQTAVNGQDLPRVRRIPKDPSRLGQKPMATRPRGARSISTTELVVAVGFGGFALLVLAAMALFGMYILFTMSSRIMPSVMVGDSQVGWMNIDDANQLLWSEWNEGRQLIVSDGEHTWLETPAQFGLYLNSAATAQKAYEIGRGKDGLAQFFGILSRGKVRVAPELVVNMETATEKLQLYAQMIDVPATDAALQYLAGTWIALPGEKGIALDIPYTLADLVTNRAVVMTSGYFTFSMKPVEPKFEDVSSALEVLQPLLNRPMRFQAYDPITDERYSWTVDPTTFAPWVRIQNLGADPGLTIVGEQLAAYLQEWQVQLGSDRILQPDYEIEELVDHWKADNTYSFIVWHQPTSYVVQPGDMLSAIAYHARMPYWKLIEANPQMDPENILSGEILTIPSKNEMLPLPIVQNKRIVINITEQRMRTYENGQLLNEYIISTGVDKSPTLPGVFQVQTHELEAYASVWDLYMPHFIGIYQGWPGFWNGIHGLPTLSSGVRLWASVLGSKASFGCIILDLASAETVYNWAEDGVVVEIQP